jgi:hypothetical protein
MRVRVSIAVAGVCLGFAASAQADGPGVGTPAVVTLGDSAISGEAGRWAGGQHEPILVTRRCARRHGLLGHLHR